MNPYCMERLTLNKKSCIFKRKWSINITKTVQPVRSFAATERWNYSSLPGNGSIGRASSVSVFDPVVIHRCWVQSRCLDLQDKHTFTWQFQTQEQERRVLSMWATVLINLKWKQTSHLTCKLAFRSHLFSSCEDDVLHWWHPWSSEGGVG